ncbi:MAG TPA: GAF domain-containing protein [Niabella sp.]|nr:GAF domain-containing protein [Niabella sp.]
MHYIKPCLVICGILLFTALRGQKPPDKDSLLFKNATAAFAMAFRNPDSALLMANNVLQQSLSEKNKGATANAYNSIGWAHMQKGHMDAALIFLQKSRALFASERNVYNVARVSMNLAELYTKQSKIAEALQYLLQADSLSKAIANYPLMTDVKRQLAIVYREAGDNSRSAAYFREAMQGFLKLGDYTRYISAAVSISILYRNMKLNDSSFVLLSKAMDIARQKNATPYQVAMLHEHIAETHLAMERNAKALSHYKQAYDIFEKLNNKADMAYEAFCVGKTLVKLNRFEEAETYLLRGYAISDTLGMTNYMADASKELAAMYQKQGNWENAFTWLQKNTVLLDSLNLDAEREKANELKEKYEAEKKEAQIELLNMRHRQTKWWFIASILVVSLIGTLLWLRRYNRKIKEQRMLNYFATSLYNQNTVDDVFWDIAKNCASRLGFEDCVIYGYDNAREMLVQKAAFGPKNPTGHVITNLLEIPLGKGIVGAVAATLQPEIIADTTKDPRYILDDELRYSEITVPIILDGKLLGIIDSEHSKKGFYKKRHLKLLQAIADTCSKKLTRYFVEESLRKQIASDLHDDIGSALSSIDVSSRIASIKKDDTELVAAKLESIREQAHRTMESMSDIVWSINPDSDGLENIISRMKNFAAERCDPLDIKPEFIVPASANTRVLNPLTRKTLFLIFKEAVNNAAKYSGCSIIQVVVETGTDGGITMRIRDNGHGFDRQTVKRGNGIDNMESRARQIGAGFTMECTKDEGVTIEVHCKT